MTQLFSIPLFPSLLLFPTALVFFKPPLMWYRFGPMGVIVGVSLSAL